MRQNRQGHSQLAWRRIGNTRALTNGFLLFCFTIYSLLTLGFDALITSNFTWLWLIPLLVTFVLFAAPIVCYRNFLRFNQPSTRFAPWLNLVVIGLAGLIKNTTVPIVAHALGLETTSNFLFRAIGGSFSSIAMFVLYATALSARNDHFETMRKLRESEEQLLGYRESAAEILEDEQQAITDRIRESLAPRIRELNQSMGSAESTATLADRLQKVIENEVRPLNLELASAAAELSQRPTPKGRIARPIEAFPPVVSIAQLLRPNTAFPMLALGYLLFSFIIYPDKSTVYADIGIVMNWGLLWAAKWAFRFAKPTPTRRALAYLALVSGLAILPTYIFLGSLGGNSVSWLLSGIYFVSGIMIPLAFAWSALLDFSRAQAEQNLRDAISNIARENKIFEQSLWISKNAWMTTLHGTIQSALTAALMRAKLGPLNAKTISEIEADLGRANAALIESPRLPDTQASAWTNLKETWAGICELKFEANFDVATVAEKSERLRVVLNETFKELVSNAVRHGGATEVSFFLSQNQFDDIEIICTNNGVKPDTMAQSNLGAALLGELLIEPKLTWDEQLQRVVFSGVTPVQIEQ
jgi:signal transduction histidine kinase